MTSYSNEPIETASDVLKDDNEGYHKALKPRQIQMIAIGGAIGTGLFMGAGGRLAAAGPSILFVFIICAFFAFMVIRALGELVLHRPSSGSFVSYAREFYGEKMAFAAGWLYWINWAMTSIADVTAAALYMNFFKSYVSFLDPIPQWIFALVTLVIVLTMNLLSVKVFGELEFWLSLIKVSALVIFLIAGTYCVLFRVPIEGHQPGFNLIVDNGGFFPNGILPAFVLIQGVIFAYASIELIGTAAGEAQNAEKVIPKAIKTVIFRLIIFYVGSILLFTLLMPYTAYSAGVSPFVTFFDSIGISGAGPIMNMVVLTAVISSLNSGLYSTGRILHSLAIAGSAPKFAARMNRAGVPYGGIVITAVVTVFGVILNAIVPEQAFEIALNLSALGIISAWAIIVLCQIRLQKWSQKGLVERPSFRMPGAPFTSWLTLGFLAVVLVLMAFDYPVGTGTIGALVVIIVPSLIIGWKLAAPKIAAIREGKEKPVLENS